jgi:biotin transport system substrate-specific component
MRSNAHDSAADPGGGARWLAQVAIFAGVIAALGLVPALQLPGMPVPITLQTLGVMLAGSILGARKGGASVLLFLALVAIGLPLLAGGRGGLGVFATPSVGFLIGWPIAAFVIGWLTERRGLPYSIPWGVAFNIIGGIIVMYAFGLVGMMAVGGLTVGAAAVALLPFIPGDIVKAVLAALIAKPVHASYPGLLRQRSRPQSDAGVGVG